MPGIELSGERRLLIIWLILSLSLGGAYYIGFWGHEPFVQRFERAYYSAFWSRPFLSTPVDGLEVGIITPRYVSSLVDSEMWLWVRNTSSSTGSPNDEEVESEESEESAVLTPLIVVDYSSTIIQEDKTSASDTSPEQATDNSAPIKLQVLLHEGDSQLSASTESSSTIEFADIYPGETAAQLVWVRLMPLAYREEEGEPSTDIYVAERGSVITIEFDFTLWEQSISSSSGLDIEKPPVAKVDTRQAVMRGFARILLLPPWSNGMLLGLSLVCAFIINSAVGLIEQWVIDRDENKRRGRGNRSAVAGEGARLSDANLLEQEDSDSDKNEHEKQDAVITFTGWVVRCFGGKGSWRWQAVVWASQISFWTIAIFAVFILSGRLTEQLIICPMSDGRDSVAKCIEWVFPWYWYVILVFLGGLFFYMGYLNRDISLKSIWETIRTWGNYRHRLPPEEPAELSFDTPVDGQEGAGLAMEPQIDSQEPDAGPPGPAAANIVAPAEANCLEWRREFDSYRIERQQVLLADNVESPTSIREALSQDIEGFRMIRDKGVELYPELSSGRKSHVTRSLNMIEKHIKQIEDILRIIGPDDNLIEKALNGSQSDFEQLMTIRAQLGVERQQFDLSPAREAAAWMDGRIDEVEREYQERFEELHSSVTDGVSLAAALDRMQALRDKGGADIKVRFFRSASFSETDTDIMRLSDAEDNAIGRLSGYWLNECQKRKAAYLGIRDKARTDVVDAREAQTQLDALAEEISGWPASLPGWERYSEGGDRDSLLQDIEKLKVNIESLIGELGESM